MGQILHGSAKTMIAVRVAIQRSQATIKEPVLFRFLLLPDPNGHPDIVSADHR